MKKLLLTSCLVLLCIPSIKAEEKQADWKEKVAKYIPVATKIGFAGLCAYNLRWIADTNNFGIRNNAPGDLFNTAHRNRNILITLVAGAIAAKSALDDLSK